MMWLINFIKHKNKGLTLIEVILSMGIFAITTVPIYSLFLLAVRSSIASDDMTIMTSIAGNAIEEIRFDLDNFKPYKSYFDKSGDVTEHSPYFELDITLKEKDIEPIGSIYGYYYSKSQKKLYSVKATVINLKTQEEFTLENKIFK